MTNTIPATEQGYGTTESNKNVLELMSGSEETAATIWQSSSGIYEKATELHYVKRCNRRLRIGIKSSIKRGLSGKHKHS